MVKSDGEKIKHSKVALFYPVELLTTFMEQAGFRKDFADLEPKFSVTNPQ